MKGINRVVLIGYVAKEPEIKPLNIGSIANIALATTETWRNRQTGTNLAQLDYRSPRISDGG